MLASLQSQRILARNGGNYVGERLHVGLPGSAPHVFIQIGRDEIPLDSEVSLKFSLTGIPPALNVIGMYTRQPGMETFSDIVATIARQYPL